MEGEAGSIQVLRIAYRFSQAMENDCRVLKVPPDGSLRVGWEMRL